MTGNTLKGTVITSVVGQERSTKANMYNIYIYICIYICIYIYIYIYIYPF